LIPYSVCAHGKTKREMVLIHGQTEFYQLGESDWKDFSRHWEMYGVNRRAAWKLGCGAGANYDAACFILQ